MKKNLVKILALLFAVSLVACSNNTSVAVETTNEATREVETTVEQTSKENTTETTKLVSENMSEEEIEEKREEIRNAQLTGLRNEDNNASSVVYFTKDITADGLLRILDKVDSKVGSKVAVKISTGESMQTNHLRPELIEGLVKKVNGTIVECNTAYNGNRSTTEEHMKLAEEHGYTKIAKVDIMDSTGEFEIPVSAKATVLKKDMVGENLKNYDSMICLSHFKGHQMAGFGGAIKNMSIGVASPNGKSYIHTAGKTDKVEEMWQNIGDQVGFEKSLAEAADAVHTYLNGNVIYINVMNNISIDCDCNANPAAPDMHDVGILASLDPVAVDEACVDIVYNTDKEQSQTLIDRMEQQQGQIQLDHSVEIGAGNKTYRLEVID